MELSDYELLVTAVEGNLTRRRIEILLLLADGVDSPKGAAAKLDVPLGVVSYDFRQLAEHNWIALAGEHTVRGAVAHTYWITPKATDVLGTLNDRRSDA